MFSGSTQTRHRAEGSRDYSVHTEGKKAQVPRGAKGGWGVERDMHRQGVNELAVANECSV
jgi:hypothetical protein